MHVHGLEQVLLGHYGQIAGSDWRWTCSGADFMVGGMCHEWDVQDYIAGTTGRRHQDVVWMLQPRVGSGVARIDPLHFLAGYRKN